MFGKLMGRGQSRAHSKSKSGKADRPIVHQTIPDGVLEATEQDVHMDDMSWLKSVPKAEQDVTQPTPKAKAVAEAPKQAPQKRAPEVVNDRSPIVINLANENANPPAVARARNPHGWLVVVEGPGVGEWFVLEKGVSHIGGEDGQTVHLSFGDSAVAPKRHAAVIYDEKSHTFQLDGQSDASIRLNGQLATLPTVLRDGDVISIGGTGLRLVALCSQNFHWS